MNEFERYLFSLIEKLEKELYDADMSDNGRWHAVVSSQISLVKEIEKKYQDNLKE